MSSSSLERSPRSSARAALASPSSSDRSWLLTGRPAIAPAAMPIRVTGELIGDGRLARLTRASDGSVTSDAGDRREPLPRCSFLRARDRLEPQRKNGGSVAARLSQLADHPTSDAVAAEALVTAVEACCDECVSGEVLLIEEPELQLTPQAQRYLYRLLRRFTETGNQVLYSTRSPAFLDAARHDEIVRLALRSGRRSIRRTRPGALSDAEGGLGCRDSSSRGLGADDPSRARLRGRRGSPPTPRRSSTHGVALPRQHRRPSQRVSPRSSVRPSTSAPDRAVSARSRRGFRCASDCGATLAA